MKCCNFGLLSFHRRLESSKISRTRSSHRTSTLNLFWRPLSCGKLECEVPHGNVGKYVKCDKCFSARVGGMFASDHPKPTAWLVGIFLRIFPVLSAIGKQELDSVLGLASWPGTLLKMLKSCFWRALATSSGSFLQSELASCLILSRHLATRRE